MLRYITYLSIFLSLIPFAGSAQNIVLAEYFFDDDPGVGNGSAIPINIPADSIAFDLSINTFGLDAGQHKLYVRTKDDQGVWSNISDQSIWLEPRMAELEYFVDEDPGIGNGTSIPVTPLSDSIDVTTALTSSGISAGHHDLYIRSRDERNTWSHSSKQHFFLNTSIVAAEYFYDTDPGIGNATAIPVSATVDSIDFNAALSTSGLSPGHHEVYVRTKDNNDQWSEIGKRHVFVSGSIVAAEYFFDEDPGIGLANSIPVTSTLDSIDFDASINISGVTPGFHQLYVRTQNDAGDWSHHTRRRVFIEKEIVAAEYFFDTDPGVGLATSMVVGNIADSVDWDLSFIMPFLPQGDHTMFIRTKDSYGAWSHYSWPDTVLVTSPVGIDESVAGSFEVYADVGVVYVNANEPPESDADFKLFDLTGRVVYSKSEVRLNDGVTAIPISGLPFATYLVELKTDDRIFVQKVLLN